jgi:hypothetical protein
MSAVVVGLSLLFWSGAAVASVCPRLLHAMGVASIERGAITDIAFTSSSTGTFFALSKEEYDLLSRVQSHCEWLEARQTVPFFLEEYHGLCGGRATFAVHREAWKARKVEVRSILALRQLGPNQTEIKYHQDRITKEYNPVLAATLPPLRSNLRKILPRLIATLRAFDSLSQNERAAVVRAFTFVGNFVGNETGFANLIDRQENFYRGYQVMGAFRNYAIAVESESESVWDIVERHNTLPYADPRTSRAELIAKIKIFDGSDTSETPAVASALEAMTARQAVADETSSDERAITTPTKPPRFVPPPQNYGSMSALAARWEWLHYRQLTENRRQEAARLAAFPAIYRDWDTLAEMEQGILLGIKDASDANDEVRVASLMADLKVLDAERTIVRSSYWATLGVIEEHVEADEKAMGKLPVAVAGVIDEMQDFLDTVHESGELLGMSEYDYRKALEQKPDWARAERIVAAYDQYVAAVAKLNETRASILAVERAENQLYSACRLVAPSTKQQSIELSLIRQTGGDSNALIRSLETVYAEHAHKNGWSWQRLTEVGDNTRVRFRVEGVGAEDFFLREMGSHSLRSRNGAGAVRDKEKVYTHEVQVRLVDSSGTLRSEGVAVRSYNDYGDRDVVDKRIDPELRSSHLSWDEFFQGGGLALFDERILAIEGYRQLIAPK